MKKILIIENADCQDTKNPSIRDCMHRKHVCEAHTVLGELEDGNRFVVLKSRGDDNGQVIERKDIGDMLVNDK